MDLKKIGSISLISVSVAIGAKQTRLSDYFLPKMAALDISEDAIMTQIVRKSRLTISTDAVKNCIRKTCFRADECVEAFHYAIASKNYREFLCSYARPDAICCFR